MKRTLRRKALFSGPLGGSRNWTVVWIVLTGMKLLRRLAGSQPEVVFRQVLEPGGAFVIRNGERKATVVSPGPVSVEE